jgi:Flp pilus assembly protein TadG
MPSLFASSRSARAQRGNMALIGALVALPLAMVAGYGVEVAGISNERALMQAAVDSGALAAASELSVMTRGSDGIADTAVTHATAQVGSYASQAQVTFTPQIDRQRNAVHLTGTAVRPSTFGFAGAAPITIRVDATAESAQSAPLCILQTKPITDPQRSRGLTLRDRGQLRAPTCLVHANSDISVDQDASITAGIVQASGQVLGRASGNAGALPVRDPFEAMNLAPITGCPHDPDDITVRGSTVHTLAPGVHCNDFRIGGNATLQLQPGEHWFLGEIEYRGNARLRGDDVVLIFGGDDEFDFGDRADIELTARRTGPFAGFLIVTTRDNNETFTIASDRVRELLGTIYIPNAHLVVSTSGNVAQDSAWSVIVAETVELEDDPVLVINTGYAGSGVPVPDGVGPNAGAPRLSR